MPSPSNDPEIQAKVPSPPVSIVGDCVTSSPSPTIASVGKHEVNLRELEHETASFDDHCQGILKKVLSHSNCNYMKFYDVSRLQFDTLSRFITSRECFFGRPRLSYLSSQSVIMVEWPSALHEAPINAFHSILNQQITSLPYPRHALSILVNQNAAMKSPNSDAEYIPDTSLSFFSKVGPRLHKYQLILEVAFTQSLTDVLQKVKDIIELFPEVVVVLVIDISESPYRSPKSGGVAWETFRNYGGSIDFDTFLVAGNGSDASSVGHPVDRLSGPKIDIDVMEGAHYAHGSTSGNTDMDRVEALLNQGFNLIKDSLVAFSRELASSSGISVDLAALQNHVVSFPLSWNFFLDEFKAAAELTAHERYFGWYYRMFRGTKRQTEEEEYLPDEGSSSSDFTPTTCSDGPGPM
ncbi:hypothetical protein HD554DRAFT_2178093 [Boletus coccyginus]|nr:hypothetical protein HD554DRAFT_2178093 [Boletus coccyginus]